MYKLPMPIEGKTPSLIIRTADNAFIPFDPANNDYANFKEEILAGRAELQDADGNVLIPSMTKDFVNTLP
jgi:hypothetical protein